jgi:hypothetical protein
VLSSISIADMMLCEMRRSPEVIRDPSRLSAKRSKSLDFCTCNTVRCNSRLVKCLHNSRDRQHALVDSGSFFHFVDIGSGRRVLDWWMGVGSVRDLGSLSSGQTCGSKKRNTEDLKQFCSHFCLPLRRSLRSNREPRSKERRSKTRIFGNAVDASRGTRNRIDRFPNSIRYSSVLSILVTNARSPPAARDGDWNWCCSRVNRLLSAKVRSGNSHLFLGS